MRSIESSFYRSRAWETTRNLYLAQVNHLCERCKAEGRVVPAVIVHHKIHLNEQNYKDASVSLNFDNLMALCLACHNETHYSKKVKRWTFKDGELLTIGDDR